MKTWNGDVNRLPKGLRRFADLVDDYYVEFDDGRKQHWIELKRGLIDVESSCHGIHETSIAACAARLKRYVKPCDSGNCSDRCWAGGVR